MTDIQKEIKEATEIYECWNWELLSEELESGYDRGALMDLVGKYKVLLKLADSQQELIEQKDEQIERFRMAANAAEKHISGTAILFSHRDKTAVLDQLRKALSQLGEQKGSDT